MSETLRGAIAILTACTIWGLSGIYFKALSAVPPLEILTHRILWTVACVAGVLALQGRLGEAGAALRQRRVVVVLAATATVIASNWFGFLFAVQHDHALEASLGYYVFPLIAVGLGYVFLGERFSGLQSVAIALAALAVAILTFGLGAPPWIALGIGLTFGLYGLLKSRLGVAAVVSVLVEMCLLAPLALAWLLALHAGLAGDPSGRPGALFGTDWRITALLMLSGPLMTAGPLILFSYAAHRLRLGTLGLMQYLNPTLQFVVAVGLFAEPFTRWHAVAFPLIWLALALYSAEAWRRSRA